MAPAVQLTLLGAPRLTVGDAPADLAAGKAIALLAYLALGRAPQPRERLIGLLWGESSDEAARKNLRNTLWSIRRALGEEVIAAEGDRLALAGGVAVDVHRFEALGRPSDPGVMAVTAPADRGAQLREALALYGGPLLDSLQVPEAPEFELWLTGERERLHQLALRLTQELVGRLRAGQQWADLRDVALQALQLDPLQESLAQALMEAHAQLGERADALRAYDTMRAVLGRELGVEPLPETEALRAAIVQGALRPAPRAAAPARPRPAPAMGGPPRAPFVGRGAELQLLDRALEASLGGQAGVVLLSGELGIGKSRLWRAWAAQLAPDLHVLETACYDGMQSLPLQPLIELFSSPVCTARLFRPGSPVAPVWLAEVARLLPEVREAIPSLPPPAVLPPEEERRHLFEAFAQCLLALGGAGLILFVDDLNWAGVSTLEWLGYLVRRLRGRPLLLVASARSEEQPPALTQLLAQWGREGLLTTLTLGRLSPAELAELIGAQGDPGARAGRIAEQSGGNPYFALELLRAPDDQVPLVLRDLIRARLERLPEQARQVAQAAAVLDGVAGYAALRRTSGRSEEETLDALDVLLGAALLIEREGTYRFAHPLVGEVVRAGLSQARRAFLHRRAGEALEAEHAGRLAPVAGLLARHFQAAGDPARAAGYAELAAEHALRLASPGRAARFYEQALAVEATAERWLGLGRAREHQGSLAEARQALAQARAAFAAVGDGEQAAQAALELADTYLSSGDGATVVGLARQVGAQLGAGAPAPLQSYAAFLLGAGLLHAGAGLGEADQELRRAAQLATDHGLARIAARSRFEQGNLLAQLGALGAAREAFRASIALAQLAGDLFQEVLSQNNSAYHALVDGDLAAAREHLSAGLALAEQHALDLPLQWLWSTRGELALAEGAWGEAADWFTRGLAAAEAHGNAAQVAQYRANLGLAARGRGDLPAAWAALTAAQALAAPLASPHLQAQIDLWLAEVALARGDSLQAAAALERAEGRLGSAPRARLASWARALRLQLPGPRPG